MGWMQRLAGGVGAREASRELRLGSDGRLRERRTAAALTLVSIGSMSVIALYQMGLIRHLPSPPLAWFDADAVDASEEAYEILRMPDAVLGLNSYAMTFALVAMGGEDRARAAPWIPLALAAKAAADASQAARLTRDQWARHRAFCSWCLLSAGATFATLAAVLPEAREAWRAWRTGEGGLA